MTDKTDRVRDERAHPLLRSPLFWLALVAVGLACGILDPWVLIRLGN